MARRSFLRYAGLGAASVGLLAASACHKDHKTTINGGVDIGSGDLGLLNFAYALEQLEAAFYIQVVKTPYSGMSSLEPMPTLPSGTADAMLDALPHPVIMVAAIA